MDVTAVFDLPVPIWVMTDALGMTYPTGRGALRMSLVMPTDRPPLGEAPNVPGVETDEEPGPQTVWAQEYGAFIPESLRPATALHRVVFTDVDGPKYDDYRSWLTPDHQLAENISRWFDDVRTWVEVITGQDLDPNHQVFSAQAVGSGLTFIQPPHDGALGVTIQTPSVLPLRANEWATILTFVRDGKEPPLEEVLSRDARAAQRRSADRRAVIDAATALEIVLGRHVRGLAAQLPEKQAKRITTRSALGDYISIAKDSDLSLAVPIDRLRWVNDLRNDAAHRGQGPSNWDAGTAVQIVIDFLGAHGPCRRTGVREPDGSEWIVASDEGDDTTDGEEHPISGPGDGPIQ